MTRQYFRSDEELLNYLNSLPEGESEGEDIFECDELDDNDDADYQPDATLQEESSDSGDECSEPVQKHTNNPAITGSIPVAPQFRTRSRGRKRKESHPEVGSEETAADGTVWTRIAPGHAPGRLGCHNVFVETPGPTGNAKKHIVRGSYLSAWRVLIDNNIIQNIKTCTEIRAREILQDETWELDIAQLEAAIGIMYARGVYGGKNFPLKLLWSQVWGPPFFSRTMGRNKFIEIMRFLRFDDQQTRPERLKTDGFAAATPIWDPFVENCILNYKPGAFITVDEQLYPCKARCRFIQYMSNKPDKFGLKFWLAADANSKYMVNGFPYLGKQSERPTNIPVAEYVVTRLMQHYTGKGRNVTCDNFFTAKHLAEQLKRQNTTVVGTLKKTRREVPPSAKSTAGSLYDTILYKSGDTTITSYQGKTNKNVLLLSTMHTSVAVDEDTQKKLPETVSLYNSTKFGVDILDQMSRLYTVKFGCRRWPMHVFFNVLDLAGINAWILYRETTGEEVTRRMFLFKLAEELSSAYIQSRKRPVPTSIATVETSKVRKTCQIGGCKSTNKTKNLCVQCKKFVCGPCAGTVQYVCAKCLDQDGGFD